MIITNVILEKCPARAKIFYTAEDGEKRWAYAYGFGVCYRCVNYQLERYHIRSDKRAITNWKCGGCIREFEYLDSLKCSGRKPIQCKKCKRAYKDNYERAKE